MNGTMHKWLLKSLGSLSLASTVVLLPLLLTGCGEESSTSTVTPVPPPPPPPPPAPPAPPSPTPTPVGRVIAISPADGATNVPITTSIVIRFSEPVREAPFAQALSITSVAPQAGVVPAGDLFFNDDRTQVTITFRTPLTNDAVYRVVISRAVPDLFASGRSLPEDFVATFTTGFVAAPEGPISLLPTQLAAITPGGQVFSNPVAVPVGFGIRRAIPAENIPVGAYTDYRAVLSFPIPDAIPRNAVVQGAQLTLVQLPSFDSAIIPGFGDQGLGFFFLDPTPHNLPSNNVVFQEVTLGAPNNVVSSDFFAPASSPTFVALSINGNVLGGDVSAGPRTADVGPGVQRAVSGSRFYQVRLQCAREVWNNQATPAFVAVLATASASVSVAAPTASASGTLGPAILTGTLQVSATAGVGTGTGTVAVQATAPATATLDVAGATTQIGFGSFTATVSVSNALPTGGTVSASVSLSFGSFTQSAQLPSAQVTQIFNAGFLSGIAAGTFPVPKLTTGSLAAGNTFTVPFGPLVAPGGFVAPTASVSASASVTASVSFNVATPIVFEVSQGATGTCRAEFDREPATGTGAGPITTARGPRLDITFTIPR
ncbi:Ig-like domain-containing protein [Synechococcus sp. 'PEA 65AY6A-5F PE A']|uniref:Ig-like domain-containing protein n=1 Tax=Synechococcus sp. 'PEA 65AY6A-5F PE A' TaxID=1504259 RepID=UPI0039C1CA70